jgi:hypothetical protein
MFLLCNRMHIIRLQIHPFLVAKMGSIYLSKKSTVMLMFIYLGKCIEI